MKIKKGKHATTSYRMVKPFLDAVENAPDKHRRFLSGGYMPLSVEYLHKDGNGLPVYSMMHWTTQNGDLMRDPDMTFAVNHDAGTVHPLTFQNDFMGLYQEVYRNRESDGALLYSPRLLTDLDDFLWNWLKNIQEQGFTPDRYEKDDDETESA